MNLTGIPETLLWTLHNRASEARRPDGVLRDPHALRIYESIDYDFERSFGKADGSHGLRSRVFDDHVAAWLATHPGGTVIELACGLETQFQRLDDGRVRWICVDLPEAMAVRDRYLQETSRCLHHARSVLDLRWIDAAGRPDHVFVTAQGLFMYLPPAEVERVIGAILNAFPDVTLMFDAIPMWFSRKTLRGFWKTKHYRTPPMPWGIARSDVQTFIRRLEPKVASVELVTWGIHRGVAGGLLPIAARLPWLADLLPSVVKVRNTSSSRARMS